MALKDEIALGMSLPHRSPDPIEAAVVRRVAQRAEALGFHDLWVTNNMLDHAGCFDSLTLLTYAAALTSTIRFLPCCMSSQSFAGLNSISRCVTPDGARASIMALATTGPAPLAPGGLTGVGVTVRTVSRVGIMGLLGLA
jgi:hypothetical protein